MERFRHVLVRPKEFIVASTSESLWRYPKSRSLHRFAGPKHGLGQIEGHQERPLERPRCGELDDVALPNSQQHRVQASPPPPTAGSLTDHPSERVDLPSSKWSEAW